ncbi:MAG: methyltransferase [Gammaproteobacteria bacterium]|nr:methyltransferase [Gammaproteobacteria bacterium]MYF29383.1 methyltransferase [Gammaproteobacteria bacterium]MYK47933.1 methyltransferase [Gammaproteobacteria bacterium]
MSEAAIAIEENAVRTTLAYATDEGDKYYYEVATPETEGRNIGRGTAKHDMTIFDAREWPEPLTLDVHGFELMSGPLPPIDFLDDACVKRLYYPAMEKLAKECTGAARIHIFDHTVRHGDPDVRREMKVKPPARGVHNDYTHWSARKRMRDLLPDEAEELLGRRFAIVQAWRAIGHRIESDPITVADARTVEESDFVPVPRTAPGRVGETWRALYNPEHRFFYYPYLSPDEAIFFKVYDSATDGRARFTLHTAFELPDAGPNAAPRHSVEMRLFAFY